MSNLVQHTLEIYDDAAYRYYDPVLIYKADGKLQTKDSNNIDYIATLARTMLDTINDWRNRSQWENILDAFDIIIADSARTERDVIDRMQSNLDEKKRVNWPVWEGDYEKYINAFKNNISNEWLENLVSDNLGITNDFYVFLKRYFLSYTYSAGGETLKKYLSKSSLLSQSIKSYINDTKVDGQTLQKKDIKKIITKIVKEWLYGEEMTKKFKKGDKEIYQPIIEQLSNEIEILKKGYSSGKSSQFEFTGMELSTYKNQQAFKIFNLTTLKEFLEKDSMLNSQIDTNSITQEGENQFSLKTDYNAFADVKKGGYAAFVDSLLKILEDAYIKYRKDKRGDDESTATKDARKITSDASFRKNLISVLESSYPGEKFLEFLNGAFNSAPAISGTIGEIITAAFVKSFEGDVTITGQTLSTLRKQSHVDIIASFNQKMRNTGAIKFGMQVKNFTSVSKVFNLYTDTNFSLFDDIAYKYISDPKVLRALRFFSANVKTLEVKGLHLSSPPLTEIIESLNIYTENFLRYSDPTADPDLIEFHNNFYVLNYSLVPASLIFARLAFEIKQHKNGNIGGIEIENFYAPENMSQKEIKIYPEVESNKEDVNLLNYARIKHKGIKIDLTELFR